LADGAVTERRGKAAPQAAARKSRVTALDAAGKRLGVYRTDREAMAAILTAARAARGAAR